MNSMDSPEEQQFCLRWNNFQANITSQFETLRDAEDFTDVTIACDGQRIQAHKVVLSACSPYFKELFKNNPCTHPIIFMRDVEVRHVMALMEFMYAGEVNVAQAHLSAFLKTAESLKIRGLTETNTECRPKNNAKLQENVSINKNETNGAEEGNRNLDEQKFCNETLCEKENNMSGASIEHDLLEKRLNDVEEVEMDLEIAKAIEPKLELPDYGLTDNERAVDADKMFYGDTSHASFAGGMEIIPQVSNATDYNHSSRDANELAYGTDSRKLHSLDPRPCEECGRVYSNLSNLRQHMKLIHYPTFVRCPVCSKTFKTDLYLRRHMITSHESTATTYNNNTYSSSSNCNKVLLSPRPAMPFHNRMPPNDCFTAAMQKR